MYKVYVDTGEASWSTNGLEFENEAKASEYGSNLQSRWTMVRRYAVVPGTGTEYLTTKQIEQMGGEIHG